MYDTNVTKLFNITMTSKEYILSKLKSFIKDFSHARVRYEFDADIESHFIEIMPNELYHLDVDYMDWEEELFHKFIEMFPGESICFLSDDALVGLESVDVGLPLSPPVNFTKAD